MSGFDARGWCGDFTARGGTFHTSDGRVVMCLPVGREDDPELVAMNVALTDAERLAVAAEAPNWISAPDMSIRPAI